MAYGIVRALSRGRLLSVVMAIVYMALALWAFNALMKQRFLNPQGEIPAIQRADQERQPAQSDLPVLAGAGGQNTPPNVNEPLQSPRIAGSKPESNSTSTSLPGVAPASLPEQTAPSTTIWSDVENMLQQFDIDNAQIQLGRMLDGMMLNDDAKIADGQQQLQKLKRPPRGNRKAARAANQAGLEALRNGENERAIMLLIEAAKSDPADVEIINNLAYSVHRTGNLPGAQKLAIAALSMAPERTAGWGELATVFADQGHHIRAVAAFQLEYRFSRNPQKMRNELEMLASDETQTDAVRGAVRDALTRIPALLPATAAPRQENSPKPESRLEGFPYDMPLEPNPAIAGHAANKTVDQKIAERIGKECDKLLIPIICQQRVRLQECSGRWSPDPPAGEAECRGAATN